MTNISLEKKKDYINNRFHQYVDLSLNTNITTTETVNLVINIQDLFDKADTVSETTGYHHDIEITNDFNIQNILNKYADTEIEKEKTAVCTRVIDGDTAKVRIINDDGSYEDDVVRFVGVNAPEEKKDGFKSSKIFVEKFCYNDSYFTNMAFDFDLNEDYIENFTEKNDSIVLGNISTWQFVLKESTDKKILLANNINTENASIKKEIDFSFLPFKTGEEKYTIKIILRDEKIKIFINEKLNNTLIAPEYKFTGEKSVLYTKGDEVKGWRGENINNKRIYLNLDKQRDPSGRLLAVVIANNKNLNEVLLKEKLAEMWYIPPSKFNPNDWKDPGTSIHLYNYKNDDLAILSPYIRPDFKNIVFTPSNDLNTLYNYEIYKGIIYVKLHPYSQYVRMHILPKAYDCSGQVLFFRDDLTTIKKNINKSNNYKVYENKNNINAYFQVNNEDRDRDSIINKGYNINEWEEEGDLNTSKTFVEFGYDISEYTKSMNNLQICAGYRYNQTSPYYALHYTGVKDNHGRPEDRCTLIDANIDNIKENKKSNIITQMSYYDPDEDFTNTQNDIIYLKHNVEIKKEIGDNDHISEIGKLHHKTLKYINDLLYIEEKGVYGFLEWEDLSRGS